MFLYTTQLKLMPCEADLFFPNLWNENHFWGRLIGFLGICVSHSRFEHHANYGSVKIVIWISLQSSSTISKTKAKRVLFFPPNK